MSEPVAVRATRQWIRLVALALPYLPYTMA